MLWRKDCSVGFRIITGRCNDDDDVNDVNTVNDVNDYDADDDNNYDDGNNVNDDNNYDGDDDDNNNDNVLSGHEATFSRLRGLGALACYGVVTEV